MIEWLENFYGPDFRSTLLESLEPLFTAYALEVWRSEGGRGEPPAAFVAGLVGSYVDHHLNSSRIQLSELVTSSPGKERLALEQRIAEWVEKRPAKVAANETVRTSNAIAVEHMRSEGVVTKRWASSGGACPYCKGLDGTAVAIERPFFTPDDSYQPEGAEVPLTFTSEIGAPPVHQGCACSVVPG